MNIDEHFRLCVVFRVAFGNVPPPEFARVKHLDQMALIRAVETVKSSPLSKFNADKCGLVIQAALKKRGGTKRRPRRIAPIY